METRIILDLIKGKEIKDVKYNTEYEDIYIIEILFTDGTHISIEREHKEDYPLEVILINKVDNVNV